MDERDRNFKPSPGTTLLLQQAEDLAALFRPLPPAPRRRSTKKKKSKQLTVKQAFKNANKPPVNFQGVPLDKCTYVTELEKHVFIHESYNKAWNKRKKEASYRAIPEDNKTCPDCLLFPCSARLFQSKLECDACSIEDLINLDEEEHREKLRRFYRAQLMKLQGKRFMTRQMPTNNDIPVCAKRMTAKIASIEAGGYDSLVDGPSPYRERTLADLLKNHKATNKENDSASSDSENEF